MAKKEKKEKDKSKFYKRIKIILCITASLLVVLLTTLYIVIISKFKDNNRSSYQTRNIEYSEIVKKNYIEGFKNSQNTQKFSYILPNEDINELLSSGVQSLNNKHIKSIYYESDLQGLRYFFVDLTKIGVKTRVVITTVPEVKGNSTISLKIASVSMGKVNALEILKKQGYLTSKVINPYFKECHLPISFNEENMSFEVSPFNYWVKLFPTSLIGNEIFNVSKGVDGAYTFNSSIFGFDLDLTSISNNREYISVPTSNTPNVYEEVKSGCLSEFPSMSEGDTKTVYSLTEEGFNKLIKSSFASTMKEEFISEYTSSNVIFDLVGANIHLDQIDKLTFSLFFSVNGYMLGIDTNLSYISSSSSYFGGYFQKIEESSTLIENALTNVLSNLGSNYTYMDYTASKMLHINLEALNDDPDIDADIKFATKQLEINPATKSLEFKITK